MHTEQLRYVLYLWLLNIIYARMFVDYTIPEGNYAIVCRRMRQGFVSTNLKSSIVFETACLEIFPL